MTKDLTFSEKLIEPMLGRPAGKPGYIIIVMERVGANGQKFLGSLKEGEQLPLSIKSLLPNAYQSYAVDMRERRMLTIMQSFATRNPLYTLQITANIYYHVVDPRKVVEKIQDALGHLRDQLVTALARDISTRDYKDVNPLHCEQTILELAHVELYGLTIEEAQVSLTHDAAIIGRLRQLDTMRDEETRGEELRESEHQRQLAAQRRKQEMDYHQRQYDADMRALDKREQNYNENLAQHRHNNSDAGLESMLEDTEKIFERTGNRAQRSFDTKQGQKLIIGERIKRKDLPQNTEEPKPKPAASDYDEQ